MSNLIPKIDYNAHTNLNDYIIDNIELFYGKVIEISGAISYKTSCLLSLAKEILNNNPENIILYIDSDNHMCTKYIKDYNIDTNRFIINYDNSPNQILEFIKRMKDLCMDNFFIFIDSISNLKFEYPFKQLSKFMIDLSRLIYSTHIIVIAANQYRYNTIQKRFASYCSKCFDLYSSLRLIIMDKINDELYLATQKNKIGTTRNMVVNIGKTDNEQL